MNDLGAATPPATGSGGARGGQLLAQCRQEQGLALDVLATMIKVSPAKLEALEAGRYHELHDAAFTRALAMAVCRALKIDHAPVLAALPQAQTVSLSASEPNQVPFRASHARLNLDMQGAWPWREWLSARWLVPAGVLAAAAAVYFWPSEMALDAWQSSPSASASAAMPVVKPASTSDGAALGAATGIDTGTPVAVPASAALPDLLASAPTAVADGSASALQPAPVAPASAPLPAVASAQPNGGQGIPSSQGSALVFTVTQDSWIEVRETSGERLLSRHVTAGETVGVDGQAPFTLKVGNVAGVSATLRGQPVDLAANARGNVVRMELN